MKPVLPASELLRTLVNEVSAMVAYWDSTQRCRFANRAYQQWFGVSPEDLIGTHIRDLLGPLYELNLPYIERALQGERQEFEREIPHPSGGSRHSLANYIPHVVDGAVGGFFVLVIDVSTLKQSQRTLSDSLARERETRERAERANEELQESEQRFRRTIDEAPIGMALVALDGRFTRVNRVLCEIVGYTASELTGLTFHAITHPEDVDADLSLVAQLARGEIERYQLGKRYLRKDGSVVDIMLHGSAVRDRDGAPLYYVAQIEDVTQNKRLTNQLRMANAKSSGILSISPDAIISIDGRQRITMFNNSAEKMFGYLAEEVLGAPLELLIPERIRAVHRLHLEDFASGVPAARKVDERSTAIVGLRKNGQEFPADAAISKLDIDSDRILTVALRDITEQKRTEEQHRFLAEVGPVLASTLDFEETLTRIANLAVRNFADLCIVDLVDDDDEISRLQVASRDPSNAALCRMLMQVPPDTSRPHVPHLALDSLEPVLLQAEQAIAALARSEEQQLALEAAGLRSVLTVPLVAHARLVGMIAFVSTTASRLYGPDDAWLAHELAQRAALAIQNARLYRTAQRATRARDELLAIVAHDLRNPLNSILLNATALGIEEQDVGPRGQKAGVAIERAAIRMNRLIQDLLDVTRVEAGRLTVEPACVSSSEIASESIEAQKSIAGASEIELRLEVAPDLPEVWADRDRLLQVFENLIGNALKFTAAGGRVSVGATRHGTEVLFQVTDTGSGIAAEHLPHVFDRFWQSTNAQRHGAGLGLPIVKGIVEAHDGRIWVESTPGQGSTFFFTLPIAERQACSPPRLSAVPAVD